MGRRSEQCTAPSARAFVSNNVVRVSGNTLMDKSFFMSCVQTVELVNQ